MLLGYNFPEQVKNVKKKNELETSLTYFWHKNEKKISLNFIFCIQVPTFLTHMF